MAISKFVKAVSRVASGTFLSRVLGLIREQVFAHLFGASMAADAFFAAYRIPNLLRDLFAEGALSSAFVPVFKGEMKEGGNEAAFALARICFSVLAIVLGVLIVIGVLMAPWLVKVIAPGFGDVVGKSELTAQLTMVMFPFLLLVALAALVMSILNSFDKFGVPAMAPALFNLGVIAAAYLICPRLEQPIFGMAYGVLIGGVGQLAFQIPSLYKLGFRFRFVPHFTHRGIKEIGRLMAPMVGGSAAGRVNIFVNTLLASLLSAGSVAYLSYAYRIMYLPQGLIAVALGTVTLPKASALAADNDIEGLAQSYYHTLQLCFFMVLPMAAFLVACGDEVIGLLFQHGKFTAVDTVNSYHALIWYSVGLIGFAGVRVTTPIYYAMKNSVRPMRFSIIAIGVNLVANFIFMPFMGFAGLALATGLGGLVNFALLLGYMPKLIGPIRLAIPGVIFLRAFFSAVLCGFLVYFIKYQEWFIAIGSHFWGRITKMAILLGAAAVGYLIVSFALNNFPRLSELKKNR